MASFVRAQAEAYATERPASESRPYKTKAQTRRRLVIQLGQKIVAVLDAGERVGRIILFDEIVLDAGFAGVGENAFPGNYAGADVGEETHLAIRAGCRGILRLRKLLDVFYVDGWEAAGIFVEVFDGIFSGNGDPAEVEFHLDKILVALLEEIVVRKFAVES